MLMFARIQNIKGLGIKALGHVIEIQKLLHESTPEEREVVHLAADDQIAQLFQVYAASGYAPGVSIKTRAADALVTRILNRWNRSTNFMACLIPFELKDRPIIELLEALFASPFSVVCTEEIFIEELDIGRSMGKSCRHEL